MNGDDKRWFEEFLDEKFANLHERMDDLSRALAGREHVCETRHEGIDLRDLKGKVDRLNGLYFMLGGGAALVIFLLQLVELIL